jgi:hypothetical protein
MGAAMRPGLPQHHPRIILHTRPEPSGMKSLYLYSVDFTEHRPRNINDGTRVRALVSIITPSPHLRESPKKMRVDSVQEVTDPKLRHDKDLVDDIQRARVNGRGK